jgi:hypothetical protein
MACSLAEAEKRSRWGWPGSVIGTPRRGMVDRRTATLMYAGRDRRSAPRRKVPLTKRAPAWPAQSTHGDRSCSDGTWRGVRLAVTGAPISAVTGGQQASLGRHLGPQESGEFPGDRGDDHVLGVLRAARRWKRPHSRSWVAQARATTWGSRPCWPLAQVGPDRRPVLVGPGRPRPAGCAGARYHTW